MKRHNMPHLRSLYKLSSILLVLGNIVVAQELEPVNQEYLRTMRLMGANNYDEAIKGFEQIIKNFPNFDKAYVKLLTALEKKNELERGKQIFEALIAENPQNAYAYHGLGRFWLTMKDYERAVENCNMALRFAPEQPEIFEDLLDALRQSKSLDEAERFLDQVIEADPDNAAAHHAQGRVYSLQNEWGKARESARKAIELRPDMYQAYYSGGWICIRSGRYEDALQMLTKGLRQTEAKHDFEYKAKFQRSLAIAWYRMGNYPKAFQLCTEALKVFQEIGDQEWIEKILGDLGIFHFETGEYAKALRYFEQAAQIAGKINDKKGLARHLNNLGIISSNLGKYPEALDYYERALVTDRELDNKRGEGIRFSNIAVVFHNLGDYHQAKANFMEALAISREIGDRRSEAVNIVNIGEVYRILSDNTRSLEFYREALKISTDIGYKVVQSAALEGIGSAHSLSGDFLLAVSYYERSLKIAKKIQDRRREGAILNSLGYIYFSLSDYKHSSEYHRQALTIGKETGIINILIESHTGLASSYEQQGKYDRALAHYRLAIDNVESVRSQLELEEHKLSFLESRLECYIRLISLLATLHKKDPSKEYDREAFYFAEKAKARALLDILHREKIYENLAAISEEFRQRLTENRRNLQSAHARLITQLSNQAGKRDSAAMATVRSEIETLDKEQIELASETRERYPEFYELSNPVILTVKDLQDEYLDESQILIEYLVGKERTFVWILTHDRLIFRTIELNRQELEQQLARISPIFKREKLSVQVEFDHRWANIQPGLLYEMYKVFLQQPAGDLLKPNIELIIIPDDLLHYFPFEILVTGVTGAGVRYLVENHPISYSPSSSLLNPELRKDRNPTKDLLAFGNPYFGEEQSTGFISWVGSIMPLNSMILRGKRFEQLPHAEVEVRMIAENFERASVYTGRKATEKRFKEMVSNYRFVHLATHNITDDRHPMYSKIVFAQTGDDMEDGYLQTYEVFNLPLNANLVVLSGCSTGLGKLSRGEGLIGVTRAFLYAGASSLVVSLWPVNDKSTAELMKYFYQNMKDGMSKHRALQKAKMKLIKYSDWKRDPFYWGAFVLIGETN